MYTQLYNSSTAIDMLLHTHKISVLQLTTPTCVGGACSKVIRGSDDIVFMHRGRLSAERTSSVSVSERRRQELVNAVRGRTLHQ